MRFVKPTKEQKEFIPTPAVTKKNIDKIGVDFVSLDYLANANDVNNVEEVPIKNEMEPSTANINEGKFKVIGADFKSVDPRVLRGE
jgi:hypothetical protein